MTVNPKTPNRKTPNRKTPNRETPNLTTPTIRFRPRVTLSDDRGAATAEYAIATMAAVAFAGLLVVIMQSDEVRGILTDMVRNALTFGG